VSLPSLPWLLQLIRLDPAEDADALVGGGGERLGFVSMAEEEDDEGDSVVFVDRVGLAVDDPP
jgi:hypothetical protein